MKRLTFQLEDYGTMISKVFLKNYNLLVCTKRLAENITILEECKLIAYLYKADYLPYIKGQHHKIFGLHFFADNALGFP
jgi:hypothetical protein